MIKVIVSERANPMSRPLFEWMVDQDMKYLKTQYSDCIRNGLFCIGAEYYRALLFKKTGEVFGGVDYIQRNGKMYAVVRKYKRYKRS